MDKNALWECVSTIQHKFVICMSFVLWKKENKMCEMRPIMPYSKDGQGHKDKYLDTSRKILSQKMFMCNAKVLILIIYL